jgi:hypothetical protein
MCVQYKKRNIPSVQVKNKPHVRGLEHVFILRSMVSMVANRYFFLLTLLILALKDYILVVSNHSKFLLDRQEEDYIFCISTCKFVAKFEKRDNGRC